MKLICIISPDHWVVVIYVNGRNPTIMMMVGYINCQCPSSTDTSFPSTLCSSLQYMFQNTGASIGTKSIVFALKNKILSPKLRKCSIFFRKRSCFIYDWILKLRMFSEFNKLTIRQLELAVLDNGED